MRRIVVNLKSCPTRLLGPYGCEWVETPTLDRLAAEGVVFDGHYSYSPLPLTNPSAAQPPGFVADKERGGGEGRAHLPLPSVTYAETLYGFDSGEIKSTLKSFSNIETCQLTINVDPFELPWEEWADGPFIIDDENREPFFDALAVRINDFDKELAAFMGRLREANLLDSCLFIITAHAGFPAGEHGILGPSQSRLHEELVHLPLIVRFPDRRLAGYRVAGFTTPDDLTNRLEPLILGERPTREFVVSRQDNDVSLRTADSCLILPLGDNPHPARLFDRPDDRFEVNNLAPSQPDRVEELKAKYFFTAEGTENAE